MHEYLFNNYKRYPITLTHGEGAFVWDDDGKKYLDFLSGIGCTILGHHHPVITKAIVEQANKILHTSNLYYSSPVIELAKYLTEYGGLDKVFFCNSGTEANEAAIKLARKYQWQRGEKHKYVILSATHSFHGRTLGALAATAKTGIHEGFGPRPAGFIHQAWDDIDEFCQAINSEVAAVILEPIQGEGGIHVASDELLKNLRRSCDKHGALLIFDEVQCGLGRSGSLFAYQQTKVLPDIITLAKGIANGLPLGAVCARKAIAAAFVPGDHGSTFGGNPVSCAAALATLQTLIQENYLSRIQTLADYLHKKLILLQQQFPQQIKSIRGRGLMKGIELNANANDILHHCLQAGLLVNITANNVLRLLPPFIITEEDIDAAIKIISHGFFT